MIHSAFSAFGIELEYMLVDRKTLDIRPLAEELIAKAGAHAPGEVNRGSLAWSNELVRHVIEIKNPQPGELNSLAPKFQSEVQAINGFLESYDACLLPTAMHPWMNPENETHLWPNNEIYAAYHRIFNCRRHGWANLQSMHINLPFADDEEFAKLHAAIRIVLPIIPALAASSPFVESRRSGFMDYRMEAYRANASLIPSITGSVIPETFCNGEEYEAMLKGMYQDIAPQDTDGVLQKEWLNSRAAIARFDRNAIEIRIADMQEVPAADLAIAGIVIDLVMLLYANEISPLTTQQAIGTPSLVDISSRCIVAADEAQIANPEFLRLFDFPNNDCEAGELWGYLCDLLRARSPHQLQWEPHIVHILKHGPLARRITKAVGESVSADKLRHAYQELAACLHAGKMFSFHDTQVAHV